MKCYREEPVKYTHQLWFQEQVFPFRDAPMEKYDNIHKQEIGRNEKTQ